MHIFFNILPNSIKFKKKVLESKIVPKPCVLLLLKYKL